MQHVSSAPKFAVIGDPLPQELSAKIHLAVLRHYAPEATYERVLVPRGELPQWLDRVRAEGYSGFNVAMPYELEIGRYLDELKMEADLTGSVNTVRNQNGRLIGYSTDALGFFAALREHGISYWDKRVLIFGAGGAASSLAHRAILDGAARVEILARRPNRARDLVLAIRSQNRAAALSWGSLDSDNLHISAARADIVIDATPQGMAGVEDTWPDLSFLQSLPKTAVVCDIVHTPAETALLKEAARLGFVTQNGVDMLLYQALVADHLFLDRDFDYRAMAKMVRETLLEEGVTPLP